MCVYMYVCLCACAYLTNVFLQKFFCISGSAQLISRTAECLEYFIVFSFTKGPVWVEKFHDQRASLAYIEKINIK